MKKPLEKDLQRNTTDRESYISTKTVRMERNEARWKQK